MIEDIRKLQTKWEKQFTDTVPSIDKKAMELYEKDPVAARTYLTDFSNQQAEAVTASWKELGEYME